MNLGLRALNRFGLGARPNEAKALSDPRGWVRAQLRGAAPLVGAPSGVSPDVIGSALRALRAAGQGDEQLRQKARRELVRIAAAESRTALTERVVSERPFVERLVAFWGNHLCVSAGSKPVVAPLAGSYEREVIRRHVLGNFTDMVLASARHPAMLFYLDNAQSVGPGSAGTRFARRGGQQRGLNENYARELLELHTLGVNGGYTQQDVTELARIMTGWTVDGYGGRFGARSSDDGPVRFAFLDGLHEPGAKTILGTRYSERGADEGEAAIRALCKHPSTARFIATKLVTHFVADAAPPAAVDSVAFIFTKSGGDLKAVADALVDLPAAWQPDAVKFRTPQDWLIAVMRALRAPGAQDTTTALLRRMRQPLWSPQSPKGYGDSTQEWADPDSLLNRGELARTIAKRAIAAQPDPRVLLDVIDVASNDPVRAMLADNSIPADERLALAIAGPAFQWR